MTKGPGENGRPATALESGATVSGATGGLESEALRSAFGFDRSDDLWMAVVRESAVTPALGRLGQYELLAEIGRGAQGAVYKAVQPGTNRVVAIKRLAAGGLATPAMLARFEREVEAICRLSHPGIVTVHGVATIEGQPTLTMEFVDGRPIDRWAAGRDRTEVLTAFAQACDAVAHAHQRAVLHRDLKPSNILVDDHGRPRVLDFGLAKVIDPAQPRAPGPGLTRTTSFLGTPAYASPEQIAGNLEAMDTRSDVYSLGIILYRLLVGHLPFDIDAELPALFDQIRRGAIRPPSSVAEGVGPELDAITLKAAALAPENRYASVDALAADVRRYLSGEVVLAHPPRALYQLRKIAARHRVAVAVGGSAMAAIGVLADILAVPASRLSARGAQLSLALGAAQEAKIRAEQEATKATASAEFLRGMIESLGYSVAAGEARPERGMLLEAKARLDSGELADQPALRVAMWRTLAQAAFRFKMVPEIEEFTRRATELCAASLGPDHEETGHCQVLTGLVAEGRRDLVRAEQSYRSAAETFRRTLGAETRETAHATNNLGNILKDLGRFEEAEQCHQTALATRLRVVGPVHRDVANSLRNLGTLRRAQRRNDEATRLYERALAVATECLGPTDTMVLSIRRHLASLADGMKRFDEAERIFREILGTLRTVYGPDSGGAASALKDLAAFLLNRGRTDEAVACLSEARDLYRKHFPTDHPDVANVTSRLGLYLIRAGRHAEAEPVLREAMDLASNSSPALPDVVASARRRLAECLRTLGRTEEAARLEAESKQQPIAPIPAEADEREDAQPR